MQKNKIKKILLSGIFILFLFFIIPGIADAESSCNDKLSGLNRYSSCQVLTGDTLVVNAEACTNTCFKITNTSGKSVFIPTNTCAEWDAFLAHMPSGIATSSCMTNPTISVSDTTKKYGDASFTITHSTNSDGTKSFSSSNPSVATITNAGVVTIVGAGTTTITFNTAETENYYAATDTATLNVTPSIVDNFDSLSGWNKTNTYGPGVGQSLSSDYSPGGASSSLYLYSAGTSGQGYTEKSFPPMSSSTEYKFEIWAKTKANGYGYSWGMMIVYDENSCFIGGWNGGDANIFIYRASGTSNTYGYYPRATNSWLRLELIMNTSTGLATGKIYNSSGSLLYSGTCGSCISTNCGPPSTVRLYNRALSVSQWWKYDSIRITNNY